MNINNSFFGLSLLRYNNDMEDLKVTLKQQIIESLNLQGMKPEDIDDNAPLFGEGLGLDSIDSLELMVLLERNYGIKIEDAREGRNILASVETMAAYIQEHRKF
jgi:acyl carrier protein